MSRSKRTTNFHHPFYYRSFYRTELERTFRELPCNKFEWGIVAHDVWHSVMDQCIRVYIDKYGHPPMPTTEQMLAVIHEHELGRCTCNVIGLESERRRRRER